MRHLAFSLLLGLTVAVAGGCGQVASTTDVDARPTGAVPLGQACTTGGDCQSGFCADGVCCTTDCDGQCEACDVANSVGACMPVTGAPHGDRAACAGGDTACGGSCDGATTATCTYPTVECGAASCTGTTRTPAATCSMGACPTATPETCALTCGSANDCVTVTQLAAGYYNTCALMSDKTVRCWGNNLSGQNGVTGNTEFYYPVQVAGLTNVKQITTAKAHSCAVMEDGSAKCWGSNYVGELGRGTIDNVPHPDPMPVLNETGTAPLAGVMSISAGQLRTCAIVRLPTGQTELRCWGDNALGALGDGSTAATYSALPRPVCASGTGASCVPMRSVFQVSVGDQQTCADVQNGVVCWGGNSVGQLGFAADNVAHPNPVFVRDNGVNLAADTVTAALGETGAVSCAVRSSDKVVLCWGTNAKGQLGRGVFTNPLPGRETPAPVCTVAPPGACTPLTGSALGAGYYHGCAISNDRVRCWGGNNSGQVGDNSETDKAVALTEVVTPTTVRQLAVGEFHTCAVLVDGRAMCWGWGEGLGTADHTTNAAPVDSPVPVFPRW